MIHFTMMRCGDAPLRRCSGHVLGVVLIVMTWPVSHAANDDYLQQLDAEVTKVERVSTDTKGDDAAPPAESTGAAGARNRTSRANFEAQLRKEQVGTYSFYRKLPERSREEVYLDYSDGASMESLRQKIIDRFLHP